MKTKMLKYEIYNKSTELEPEKIFESFHHIIWAWGSRLADICTAIPI